MNQNQLVINPVN